MLLHLRMDEGGDGLLVAAQDLACIVFGQRDQKVPDGLPGQIIEKVRVVIVSDVVGVDEAADPVVLQPGFLEAALSQCHDVALPTESPQLRPARSAMFLDWIGPGRVDDRSSLCGLSYGKSRIARPVGARTLRSGLSDWSPSTR
jgi:hypothetical protein